MKTRVENGKCEMENGEESINPIVSNELSAKVADGTLAQSVGQSVRPSVTLSSSLPVDFSGRHGTTSSKSSESLQDDDRREQEG